MMQCQHKQPPARVRTLVVDDSEVALRTISTMLKFCGRLEIVGTATDGQEAVEKNRELAPELIVMDLQMPRMDGFQSASMIRKECPLTRIVHVTTHDDPTIREASRVSGADHFMSKSHLPKLFCELFCDMFGVCRATKQAS
jgi:CheY-like chemotaxis protein